MSTREDDERRLAAARAERYGSALVSLPEIYRAGHAEYNRLRAAGVDVEDIPSRVRGRERIYQHARWLHRKDRQAAAAAGLTVSKISRDTPDSVPTQSRRTRDDRRMAGVQGRKKNPTVGERDLRARVSAAQHAKISRMADALGISIAAVMDKIIAREVLDENGRPVAWPADDQQELPLKSA